MLEKDMFKLSIPTELGGAVLIAANIILRPLTRSWYGRWGATSDELTMSLPGDDLIANPTLNATRAITIRATPGEIWPWMAQIGQGRAGLYSYERLENLAGCQMKNATQILPECQNLQPGELVRLGPPGYPALPIYKVEPGRYLLLFANGIKESMADPTSGAPPVDWCWLFYLRAYSDRTSRLIIRSRMDYPSSFAMDLSWKGLIDPIHFVMERQTLLGIKKRVESSGINASTVSVEPV